MTHAKLTTLTSCVKQLRAAGFEVSAAIIYGERDQPVVIIKSPDLTLTCAKDGQAKIGIAEVIGAEEKDPNNKNDPR